MLGNPDGVASMSGLEHWEDCYQKKDTPWDKGEPSPGLVDFLNEHQDLETGSVCVPGCGMGHDALAWSGKGFDVTGVDVAPTAVERARIHSKTQPHSCSFKTCNFLEESPDAPFDWVFEHTFYCAIKPERRQDYLEAMQRWIKPGGYLLAVHYLIPDKDGPPFGTTRDEVFERFSKQFELIREWVPRSYPNRTGLERMFWWQKPTE
ncbi:MAG: methyltransferase domain-containing protein [Verrucomicrobia bacterium]|nr:methyltransferase domain-containing protein [Verrucomicrobiota bacterium]